MNLLDLTNEELLQEQKKMKSSNYTSAFLIGGAIGVAIFSTVKYGFGFFTFFPVIFAFYAFSKKKKNDALEAELKSRGLK